MTRSFENCENKPLEEYRSKESKSNTDHVRRMYEQAETSSSGPRGSEVSQGIQEKGQCSSLSSSFIWEQLEKKLVEHCCSSQDGSTLSQIEVGQQLGNYYLVKRLGKGSFGKVFLGEHIVTGEEVAVKVLKYMGRREDVKKFCKEIKTLDSLDHQHIVRLLEFGCEDKVLFLVMEYASHGTLKGKRLHPMQIANLLEQFADALDYMHIDKELIHRDIKPANLLLRTESDGLVGDLGLAAPVGTKGTAGTHEYMAPEQLNGKACPASDQYALALIGYELATGKKLIECVKEHNKDIIDNIKEQWVKNNKDIIDNIWKEHVNDKQLRNKLKQKYKNIEYKLLHEKTYDWIISNKHSSTQPKFILALARALHRNPNRRFSNMTAFAQTFKQACWEWSQHHLQGRPAAAVRYQAFERAAVDQEQTQRRRRNRLAVGHHQAFEQAAADQEQTQCRRRNRPAIEHHQAFERVTTDQEQTQQRSSKKGLCRYVKRFLKKLSGCVWSRCYTSQDDALLARTARISNSEEDVPSLEPCSECELMNLI